MSRLLDLADRVVAAVGDRGEAEVTVSAGTSALTRFANSNIHQNVAEDRLEVALRVAVEGRLAGGSTTATDDEGLRRLAEDTGATQILCWMNMGSIPHAAVVRSMEQFAREVLPQLADLTPQPPSITPGRAGRGKGEQMQPA